MSKYVQQAAHQYTTSDWHELEHKGIVTENILVANVKKLIWM